MSNSPLKKYKVGHAKDLSTPAPNPDGYGVTWSWDSQKEEAGQLLAEGCSQQQVADTIGVHRNTIRNWLKVAEFTKYVDEQIMETGVANSQIRLAKMKQMAGNLETAFGRKLEQIMIDPSFERLSDLSKEYREMLKQIATERGQYVELTKTTVEHTGGLDLNVDAKVEVTKVENYLSGLDETERSALEKEFAKVADKVVAEFVNGNNK